MNKTFVTVVTAVKYWLHYTLVAIAWLGIVPLTACRIYRALFATSVDAIFTLPFDMLSTDNLATDILHGCFVVSCTLFAFVGLVWLREQILHGGGPDWLQRENLLLDNNQQAAVVNNNVIAEEGENNLVVVANQILLEQAQPPPPPLDLLQVVNPIEQQDVAAAAIPDENNAANNGDEENNWNPMEWDRAAEELTWERLLGLDGSLLFLEHVFWVAALNSLFIVIFAFCPYHMGLMALNLLNMREPAAASHFEGLLTTLIGYCVVGTVSVCTKEKINRPEKTWKIEDLFFSCCGAYKIKKKPNYTNKYSHKTINL